MKKTTFIEPVMKLKISQPTYNKTASVFLMLFSFLVPLNSFAQEAYEHGHGAMQLFDEQGMKNTPQWVMIWVYFMLASFAASLFFVKDHVEARWVAGGFLAGVVLMTIGTRILGIPPLSGFIALMHIIGWTPALVVLVKKRPFMGPSSAFSIWAGVMTAVIIFSFIFDIRDAAIFLSNY